MNNIGDAGDASPGDGVCATVGGVCTLRAAIQEVNAGSATTIDFGIGFGPATISPASALPALTGGDTIDGTSQPGYRGLPIIQLSGASAGAGVNGLTLNTSVTVTGLVINQFGGNGILATAGSAIRGCFIGTDLSGTIDRGNGGDGIHATSSNQTIGGPAAGGPLFGQGNLISGNGGNGISIVGGVAGNTVEGNFIGTNLTASAKLGNSGAGVAATTAGSNQQVGAIGVPGFGNVIGGNGGDGISLKNSSHASIDANSIGTDRTRTVILSNTGNGITIADTAQADVGEGSRNSIYNNTGAGIRVTTTTTSNYLAQNDIFFNGGLGIDLGGAGVTPNDTDDPDTGPNTLQNFPVLSSPTLSSDGHSVTFHVALNSNPNFKFEIDYYVSRSCDGSSNGEGESLDGTSVGVLTNSSGDLSLTKSVFADPGEVITATASRMVGSPTVTTGTSEFSACLSVPFKHTFTVNSNLDTSDASPGNGVCETTTATTCTLRAAIQETNALAGRDRIKFAINTGGQTISPSSALPSITEAVTIDGTTQPTFSNVPLIELNGASAGADVDGLTIAAGRVTVKALAINRFSRDGIRISGNDATIESSAIGTDRAGATALGNGGNGITISAGARAQIGGAADSSRGNVISGNAGNGIQVSGLLADVEQNKIGTNRTGTAALANGGAGVLITAPTDAVIGGAAAPFRNVISGNTANGVEILGNGTSSGFGNGVDGNFIGVGTNGTTAIPNGLAGVRVGPGATNTNVGGGAIGDANVISANGGDGVSVAGISTTGTSVRGNLIGTDATGTADAGNAGSGISVSGAPAVTVGGAPVVQRNVISGNDAHGVFVTGGGASGATMIGNTIGLTANGIGKLPNDGDGIFLHASNAVIGGTALGAGNLIAGNLDDGVSLSGSSAAGTTLLGNLIGIGANSAAGAGNGIDGIGIAGAPNTIVGGGNPGEGNVVSGNGSDGIQVSGAGATGTQIQGNDIGTNGSGVSAVGNASAGIRVLTGGVSIGGSQPGSSGNVIAGNTGDGVAIVGASATNTTVGGDLIGVTTVAGTLKGLGNGGDGVLVSNAPNNAIGTTQAANVIGANGRNGVELAGAGSTGNIVAGNTIGTDGTKDLGNTLDGVLITGPTNTLGSTAAGNVISGNGGNGVTVAGANGTTIVNSRIGVNAAGTSALSNGQSGIFVQGSANTTIGDASGTTPPNTIGGNVTGVTLDGSATTGTVIALNTIGDGPGGTGAPNTGAGIRVQNGAHGNVIGGLSQQTGSAGNIIQQNGLGGIVLPDAGTGNKIQANSINANGGLGIDLGPVGVTANDAQDPDPGPNNLQNFPVLTSAVTGGGSLTITGSINSTPNTVFTLDVYSSPSCDPSGFGEGATYVGTATLGATDGSGNRSFPALDIAGNVAPNQAITVTATDPNGNTSEFSSCVSAPEARSDVAVQLTDSPDPVAHGSNVNYTATVTDSGPDRSLGTTLTLTLGTHLTFVSSTTPQGSCTPSGTRVVCDLGTVAPGQTVAVKIKATASASFTGTITNTATVASDVTDPNSANNAAKQTTTVT